MKKDSHLCSPKSRGLAETTGVLKRNLAAEEKERGNKKNQEIKSLKKLKKLLAEIKKDSHLCSPKTNRENNTKHAEGARPEANEKLK